MVIIGTMLMMKNAAFRSVLYEGHILNDKSQCLQKAEGGEREKEEEEKKRGWERVKRCPLLRGNTMGQNQSVLYREV